MKLNNREKDIQKQLQADADIPEVVTEKIQTAYHKIQDHQVQQKSPKADPFHWMKITARTAAGFAAAFAVAFVICVTNPVMARELPLIGKLFERLQNEVSFFGNFADNAAPLTKSDTEADSSAPDNIYSKTSDGLTITLSEIYANESAIYLTMLLESEEPFPDTMMNVNSFNEPKPVFDLTYAKSYSFMPDQGELPDQAHPEGVLLDDRTYSCILRIDLDTDVTDSSEYWKKKEIPETFTLNLDFSKFIGYKAEPKYWDPGYIEEELTAMSDEEWHDVMIQEPAEYSQYPNEHQNYWFEGPWSFEIPVTIDTSQTVTLELNETNEAGIGLDKIVKTPYEITVYDKYESGAYSDTMLVALDANGNKLPYNDSNPSANNFAIQDRDISTVDVYILDYTTYMDELKGVERYNNNENKPEEEKWSALLDANALYHKTVHFD